MLRFTAIRSTTPANDYLERVLSDFEAQCGVKVDLQIQSWSTAWSELTQFGVHGNCPDVSVVGTTWVPSLVAMQSLKPFRQAEVEQLGSADAFLSAIWRAGCMQGRVWAIPWVADTRVIFYWRDALVEAGIDEALAFSTYDQFERTVARLAATTQPAIVTPTILDTQHTLQNLAPWVWSAGGDFRNPPGDRVVFDRSPTLEAIQRFFRLHRAMAGVVPHVLSEAESDGIFGTGRAALTVSGPWVIDEISSRQPERLQDLGAASLPGISYVGGSSIVIWGRSLYPAESLALVRHLTGRAVQERMAQLSGQLPARADALDVPLQTGHSHRAALAQSVRCGRTMPGDPLWGQIEARLHQTLGALWGTILESNVADWDRLIAEQLSRLASQLNRSLESYAEARR